MSNYSSSSEAGDQQPVREEWEPEILEFIAKFAEQLGSDGLNAIHRILHAERDLRTIASIEPEKFIHALESADRLSDVRAALTPLIEQAAEITRLPAAASAIGKTAIDHFPEQKEKQRPLGRRFSWRRGGDSNSR